MYLKFILLIIQILSLKYSDSAQILAIMPTPSYSHHIVFEPLWLELNSRGHHVTLLTTNPIKKENLTNFRQVDWSFAYDLWHNKHNLSDIIKHYNSDILKCLRLFTEMTKDITIQELSHPAVKQLLANEKEHFDLVITEILTPAMMAFSHRFKCPFIGISPMDVTNFVHESLGNSISPAAYADFASPFDSHMNFFERVLNVCYYVTFKIYFKYFYYPEMDLIVQQYIDENTPKLEAIQKNASMVFLNINPILNNGRPTMPNVLKVGGGIHLTQNIELPSDIKKFLDDSTEVGVIYFSLGTNANSAVLTKEAKTVILETFQELPFKVLWKFDEKISSDSKIYVKSWMPQQQILAHPSMKLFITQGGMQSLEEAIYNAVPVVGMPIFVDQVPNIRTIVRKGMGLKVDFKNINKIELKQIILEVINNEKYKRKAEELSTLLKEQPTSALTEMVHWSEYVIKYKSARLLKHTELPFYQYLYLDIMVFFILLLLVIVYLQYKCLRIFIECVKKKRSKSVKLE